MNCPKCGACESARNGDFEIGFMCESLWLDGAISFESYTCIRRQRDALAARVKRLEEALVSIQEYWNRDANENAMLDACEHAINTAADALEPDKAKEAK